MIEGIGLQIHAGQADLGQGGLGQDVVRDILYRGLGDFVDRTDVCVFPRCNPGDDLAPCHLGIDDRLTAAAAILDHHDEILHARSFDALTVIRHYFRYSEACQEKLQIIGKFLLAQADSGQARPNRPCRPGGGLLFPAGLAVL